MSKEFEEWCKMHLEKLAGSPDTTLVEFLMTVDSEAEIREHLYTYLGKSDEVKEFASGFLQHKNFQRKKTHTVKQKSTSTHHQNTPTKPKPSPSIASAGSFGILGVQSQSSSAPTDTTPGKKKRNRNRRRKKR